MAEDADSQTTGAASDEFESRYMADGSRVLHRDKRISRGIAALLAVPGLFTIGLAVLVATANATASRPVPPYVLPFVVAAMVLLGLMFLLLSVGFAVVRTVVTEQEVNVKYGLSGPRIQLEDITSVRVVPYEWTKFGGWGIRIGIDGTRAYVPASGDVLEICYQDGGDKRVLIGVKEPHVVARQIQRARAARLRIDEQLGDDALVAELEAVAEAEAALDASTERVRGH